MNYTEKEDLAIYKHIANRPKGTTVKSRIKSALRLKSVDKSRTEGGIRNRWATLAGPNPPMHIYYYRGMQADEEPKKSPITALKDAQQYHGVEMYVGVKQMDCPYPTNAYAAVEVEFEETPKPKPRRCMTLDEAVEELRKQGAKKAVIPLRFNKKITVIFKD